MLTFETVNELTLKVTCTGSDVLFTKAGAFIAGENAGGKNYKFEKVLLGPQNNIGQALLGQLARRVTGENLPLMKVTLNGYILRKLWSACCGLSLRAGGNYLSGIRKYSRFLPGL